jgi:hypothetical protein
VCWDSGDGDADFEGFGGGGVGWESGGYGAVLGRLVLCLNREVVR